MLYSEYGKRAVDACIDNRKEVGVWDILLYQIKQKRNVFYLE